jgi:HlyD family secretion protein
MNYIKILPFVACAALLISSCVPKPRTFDASGAFEAEETIISSEASGILRQFTVSEGQTLEAGQRIGYVDSVQLFLRKKQLTTQISALLSKKPNIAVQIATLQEQLRTAENEKNRFVNLAKAGVATGKQVDDLNASIEVIKKQLLAQQSSLEITSEGMTKETLPLHVQIEQLDDQLSKCTLTNPIHGTVLAKYAEANEMTSPGKALYKIADLSDIILRVYISGNQLANVKLNQQVSVNTDDGKGGMKSTRGTITWINDKAEFTPKTIQTKDERANMVYAVKVRVKNDGFYKIGMYGEINLQ